LSVEARYLEPELPDELDDAYAQTFDRLRRMFRARGCSAEEAADLAQEAAIRAFTHIRRWGVNGAGLDPLLNRIARNLLIDRYRRVTPHLVSLDSADDIHDPTQDPSEEVARRQRRTAVQSAIRSLPVRHQKAIVYSLSGLSPEEVGRQMGIGRNAADALLHRARRSLREHLAPVREGMWGIALAVRLRWDRVTRKVRIQSGAGEAAGPILSSAALGFASVAVVIVVGVGGGVAGHSDSLARLSGSRGKAPAAAGGAVRGAEGGGAGGAGSGSSLGSDSVHTFQFGPTKTTSQGSKGVSNEVSVPDPRGGDSPPLVEIQQWIWRDPSAAPPPDRQDDVISRALCHSRPLCDLAGVHA
jgi:RNA polymerase sigma-70 factor, ECF subfamily